MAKAIAWRGAFCVFMNSKEQFIENEILASVVRAAFSRIRDGIYSPTATLDDRNQFIYETKKYLSKIRENYTNKKGVTFERHVKEISELRDNLSKKGNGILREERITFGIAQKLLNLYLKYLWCLGIIGESPHCPIDATILSEIDMHKPRWPRINENEYVERMKIIQQISQKDGLKIAQWELNLFNKKNPSYKHADNKSVENSGRNNSKKDLKINVSMSSKNSRKIKV